MIWNQNSQLQSEEKGKEDTAAGFIICLQKSKS